MSIETDVLRILDSVLSLQGRSASLRRDTPLLGALPELDSMAVLGIITALEERFAFVIHDDEIDSAVFATLGSLIDFVTGKLAD
ncbi:MAG: acyl carrier protein [Rhodoferax ferrireducens]|uniref:Acyl carrier protein n=1 Tax=Rhodoferax ferrireducens TaxID=192843 RepID=A0A1W9KV42_9BURK|nr:MAG: acyl carrier protein [Rhodoferax ferrireducens]